MMVTHVCLGQAEGCGGSTAGGTVAKEEEDETRSNLPSGVCVFVCVWGCWRWQLLSHHTVTALMDSSAAAPWSVWCFQRKEEQFHTQETKGSVMHQKNRDRLYFKYTMYAIVSWLLSSGSYTTLGDMHRLCHCQMCNVACHILWERFVVDWSLESSESEIWGTSEASRKHRPFPEDITGHSHVWQGYN